MIVNLSGVQLPIGCRRHGAAGQIGPFKAVVAGESKAGSNLRDRKCRINQQKIRALDFLIQNVLL